MRKPMTYTDPQTAVQKVVRSHIGYKLICDHCGKEMFFHRSKSVRKHQIVKGWHTRLFCSAECKREAV